MKFLKQVNNKTCTIDMSGQFTFSDHTEFRTIIGLFDSECDNFVFDMSKVEFIDSAALGMLLLAREEAEKHGVSIEILQPKGQVQKMFQVSKFDTLFNIVQ